VIATNNGGFPWKGTAAGRDLEEALERQRQGEIAPEELRAAQDRAIRGAIEAQARAGLDLLTDGLVKRRDPASAVAVQLGGVEPGAIRHDEALPWKRFTQPVVVSEVSWRGPILAEDFLFASEGSPRPVKVVITGPYTLARLCEDRVYGDPMALAMALAFALNQELRSLQQSGATFLQIDEPALIRSRDEFPLFTRIWEVVGRGVTATLCLHLEGGGIADLYPGITRLKRLGCLSLDCVAGRASLDRLSEAPFPEGLRLGLGVVDGRLETVESPETIADSLRPVRGLPPHDRLLLGTASDLGGLSAEVAAAKLRALSQSARILAGG
jgi:5-methyltetrahydropteroyltriglutamate--homocysteine methyltransferase